MKQKSPLNQLRDLIITDKMTKYPNMRREQIYVNTFDSVKPEIRHKKRTVEFINRSGCYAKVVENRAKRKDNRVHYVDSIGLKRTIGRVEFRPSDVENGHSDCECVISGRTIFLELKRKYKNGKDRQSAAQKKFQEKVERSGALYIIFESFDDFVKRIWPVIYKNPMISKEELDIAIKVK